MLREREDVLRDFAAPVDFFAAGLRAAEARLVPALDDFARVDVAFFAVLRLAVERFAVDLRAPPAFFAALLRLDPDDDAELPAELVLAFPSIDHLPDITRCAASATASAMIEPNFVALETTLLAARSAVSAASRPASRIFLRAAGLALIAAAAAARPAASISLLIAALASLSTVLSLEPERDEDEPEPDDDEFEREELLRADLAISNSLRCAKRHFRAVPVP